MTRTDEDIACPKAIVEATNQRETHTHPENWTCCTLPSEGSLEVWFSYRVFQISFLDTPV